MECERMASSAKYHCDVCNVAIKSYDIKHHYKAKTNFKQLQKLNDGKDEKVVEEELGEINEHTKYMVKKGYSKTNLPSYITHRREKLAERGPMDISLFPVT